MDNEPKLWISDLPIPKVGDHKYSRGQVVVLGGAEMTGAACLSADAAARIGVGLVTIISPHVKNQLDPLLVYKCFKPYIMVKNDITICEFVKKAKDKGRICPVVGPGLGCRESASTCAIVLSLLCEGIPVVMDADALNVFEGSQDSLWAKTHESVVLTPHEGEFVKLFPDLACLVKSDRTKAAEEAASRAGAVVVLKGSNTVIAAPNKDSVINVNANAYLATAGSGDVLSGMIAGLIAQGLKPYTASCMGVWMHGRASEMLGAGLVASDLIEKKSEILKEMLGIQKKLG